MSMFIQITPLSIYSVKALVSADSLISIDEIAMIWIFGSYHSEHYPHLMGLVVLSSIHSLFKLNSNTSE